MKKYFKSRYIETSIIAVFFSAALLAFPIRDAVFNADDLAAWGDWGPSMTWAVSLWGGGAIACSIWAIWLVLFVVKRP